MKSFVGIIFVLLISLQANAFTRCFELTDNQVFTDRIVQPTRVVCLNTWITDASYNSDAIFQGPAGKANGSVSFPLHCVNSTIYETEMTECAGAEGYYGDTLHHLTIMKSQMVGTVQTYKLFISTSASSQEATAVVAPVQN